MGIKLNHTIVFSRAKDAAAAFYTEILGLPHATPFGPFLAITTENEVTLDFYDSDRPIVTQHYAFLVGESEFDQILGRIQKRGLSYWADPFHRRPGEVNTDDGGRGAYFEDPSGHNLEIITRPYGSGSVE
jgi:catechol 2,3-dioxygenase-like lactoylglutathione lyase family enzyme